MTRVSLAVLLLVWCRTCVVGQSVTGGFLYGMPAGRSFWTLDHAAGFTASFQIEPRRWLAVEAGYEQIVRPTGDSICCRYTDNAMDQLYLALFGVRLRWQREDSRIGLSFGGGGAYANHHVGQESPGTFSGSAWGAQTVAAVEYALTRSGRVQLGGQARFYYLDIARYERGRLYTVGPVLRFRLK